MISPRSFAILTLLFVLLISTACTNSPATIPTATPTPTTVSAALTTPTLPPPPAPSTPTPATVIPTATAPVLTPAGGDPACLNGSWRMEAEQINDKLSQLINVPAGTHLPQAQPGSFMLLTFQPNGTWSMTGNATLRGELPEGYIEGTANYNLSGTYSVNDTTLTLTSTTHVINFDTLRANINGQQVEIPLTTNPFPPEAFDLPSSATYRCTSAQLQVSYTIHGLSATETWLPSR